jgi:hypothetical protein
MYDGEIRDAFIGALCLWDPIADVFCGRRAG